MRDNNNLIEVRVSNRRRKMVMIVFSVIFIFFIIPTIIISIIIMLTKKVKTTTIIPTEITITKSLTTQTSTLSATTMTTNNGLLCSTETDASLRWVQNGTTVAGGNGWGKNLTQVHSPSSIYVDEKQNIYILDVGNRRIVEWENGATIGQVIFDSYQHKNFTRHLRNPITMAVDEKNDHLFICDPANLEVIQLSRQNNTNIKVIINNIDCQDMTVDNNGYLYVADYSQHQISRWKIGDTNGTIVAGGNGCGYSPNQICYPKSIAVDQNSIVYIVDAMKGCIVKWTKDTQEGLIIAGGLEYGNIEISIYGLYRLNVDPSGNLYIADDFFQQIMRWSEGDTHLCIAVGGNGEGEEANQLYGPADVSFDREGNIYVADYWNNRIQKFNINTKH